MAFKKFGPIEYADHQDIPPYTAMGFHPVDWECFR
jgi:hypothetical protein